MRFAFYDRLSAARKRIYDTSDTIVEVELPAGPALAPFGRAIGEALPSEDRRAVERACQALVDELVRRLAVPPVRVTVYATRPEVHGGELHGLYLPEEDEKSARIRVWMRTRARHRVVAFRTFVRTLVHEICHHLDYEHYGLAETFHTEGFYKRESSLLERIAPKGHS